MFPADRKVAIATSRDRDSDRLALTCEKDTWLKDAS